MRRRNRINKQILRITSPKRKEKLKLELIDIESKLNKSRKKSKYLEEIKAIETIKKNPKYFYSYAKRFSKCTNSIGPLKDKSGNYIYNNQDIANAFSDQYKSVFSKPDVPLPPARNIFPDDDNSDKLNDIHFTEKDLVEAINELSDKSSSGPDDVASVLLKNAKDELSTALHILWRKCLDEGVTPNQLKESEVAPIHKGGSMAIPVNFRPISLTSHIVKIFEKIVRKYIVNYLNTNSLFNANQHGFRRGRSCLSQLLIHYEQILSALENGNDVDVVYLDFCKAFDKVDFGVLLKKIKLLGIGGKVGRWIYSFLAHRKQVVVVNGTKSRQEDVLSGVPQGTVLGPLLFVIYIGNIDSDVEHSTLRCFADDSRVLKTINGNNDYNLLQSDLIIMFEMSLRKHSTS